MLKKYPVIESMTRLLFGTLKIRVWRNEEEVKDDYNNNDILKDCSDLTEDSIAVVAERIAAMPRVNAVEVVNEDGDGIVIYVSWP